jgi:nucleoside-diphosphate-sugar epimerase
MPKSAQKAPHALIVGVAGFVGSYLAESLCAQNVHVIGIDTLLSINKHYLDKLTKQPLFNFLEHDINNGIPQSLQEDISIIIHAAGIEEYLNSFDVSLENLLVNAKGTIEILEYVKKNPTTKFMLCSTHDVYSGVMSALTLDHYFGLHERDTKRYAHHEAKRFAESLTAEYYRKYRIDARVVRVSDIYGPRMNLQAATDLSRLIKKAVTDDTLSIYGDGLKKLRPTFIHDVISGMCKALFFDQSKGKIYTLVSDSEMTVLECAYSIQKNSNKPLKIQFLPRTEEILFPSHKLELLHTQQDLGWRPKKNFDEGITETLEFFYLQQTKHEKTFRKNVSNTIVTDSSEITIPQQQQHPLYITKELPSGDKSRFHTSHVFQLVSIATSIFVVLVMAVFPYFAMHYYANKASNKISSDLGSAVTNSKIASNQINQLEWFFTLAQKRTELENSRTLLKLVEESQSYTSELSYIKSLTLQHLKATLANNANAVPINDITTKIDGLQEELLRAKAISPDSSPTLFTDQTTKNLFQIQKVYDQNYTELTKLALYLLKAQEFLITPERTETDWFYIENNQILASGILTRNRTGVLLSLDSEIVSPSQNTTYIYLDKVGLNTLSNILGAPIDPKDGMRQLRDLHNTLQQNTHKINISSYQEELLKSVQNHHLAMYSSLDRCLTTNQLLKKTVNPPTSSTNRACIELQTTDMELLTTNITATDNALNFELEAKQFTNEPSLRLVSNTPLTVNNLEYLYPRQINNIRALREFNKYVYNLNLQTQGENIATFKNNLLKLEITFSTPSHQIDEYRVLFPYGSQISTKTIISGQKQVQTTGSSLEISATSPSIAK